MPTTFTWASKPGRFIDVCTSACAARWKTDVGIDLERLANVVLEQPGGRIQVLALARREVVDDQHLVTPGEREHRRDSSR